MVANRQSERTDDLVVGRNVVRPTTGVGEWDATRTGRSHDSRVGSWTLRSEWQATFRAESINFFNTPQFADPNPDLSSPAFGKITNTLNDGRSFQFTLQLRF